jgi:DNA-binding MarR family transcriptional regulator
MAASSTKQAKAAEVWRQMFDVLMSTRWQRDLVLQRLDLTPNDSKALGSLDPAEGKSMRVLAEEWGTDASNVTWIVDRLERKGLAERRATPTDRRVKLVVLTPKGARTREAILRDFYEPPPELLTLERRELDTLSDILGRLRAATQERTSRSRSTHQ